MRVRESERLPLHTQNSYSLAMYQEETSNHQPCFLFDNLTQKLYFFKLQQSINDMKVHDDNLNKCFLGNDKKCMKTS